MAAGDVAAVRIASTAKENGWIAEVDITQVAGVPAISGTYAFGLGTNNDPTNAKIVFTVTSPGYDSTGTLGTIVRTVYGTIQERKAYPNQAVNDEAAASNILTLKVALSDFIYTGDTVTVVIGAGFYSQGGTPTNAFSGSVTNNSTLTHPLCIGKWSWVGYEAFQAAIPLTACIFHRSGRGGKPVACVEFSVTDGTTTKVVKVTDITKTTRTNDQGGGVILEYAASFNASDFIQGAVLTANFKAYPFVGGSGAVLDTSTGTTPPSEVLGPLKLLCDKNGTYGGGVAVVDAGGGGLSSAATTNVFASQAAAENVSTGYPGLASRSYTTIGWAVQAIKAYNNANLSRNNPGGGIILLTGNHAWPGTAPGATMGAQNVWLTITRLSTKTRAQCVINTGTNASLDTQKVKLYDITMTGSSTGQIKGTIGTDILWVDYCNINMTGTAPFYQYLNFFATRNSVTALSTGFIEFSTDASPWVLVRGNTSAVKIGVRDYCMIGNYNVQRFPVISGNNSGAMGTNDGGVCAFNITYDLANGLDFDGGGYNGFETYTKGYAFIQNLIEKNAGADPILQLCADGRIGTANNILFWHNTFAGERLNIGYNDGGPSTTVSGAVTLNNTVITVASTNGFPASGSFVIAGTTITYTAKTTGPDTFTGCSAHPAYVGGEVVREISWQTARLMTNFSLIGNVFHNFNNKDDTFDDGTGSQNAARTGSWSVGYSVGSRGNHRFGSYGDPEWFGEFAGLDSLNNGSWGFLADYSNNLNGSGGTPAIYGNYRPLRKASSFRLVPIGISPLPYDITGLARSSSKVTAGVYEVVDDPLPAFALPAPKVRNVYAGII